MPVQETDVGGVDRAWRQRAVRRGCGDIAGKVQPPVLDRMTKSRCCEKRPDRDAGDQQAVLDDVLGTLSANEFIYV